MHRSPDSSRPGSRSVPKDNSLLRPIPGESLWWERQHNQGSRLDVEYRGGIHSTAPVHKRILLVDEDKEVRQLMRAFLEPEGYHVFSCGDSLRAIQTFCARGDMDLVITDLHMPIISGLRLAEEMAAFRPHVPILIASSGVLTSDIWRRIQAAHWHFLSKPFHIPGALETIRGLLDNTTANARFV